MRDGTVLSADVYRPQGEESYPVLLQRTPYDKTLPAVGLMADPLRLAGAGYAVVVQDTRGRFGSDGDSTSFATTSKMDTTRSSGAQHSRGRTAKWGCSACRTSVSHSGSPH